MLENETENLEESSQILRQLGSFVHAQIVEIDDNISSTSNTNLFSSPYSSQSSSQNSFLFNKIIDTTTTNNFEETNFWPQTNSLFYSHPLIATLISILIFALILITILGNLGVCAAILLVRKLKAQPANLLLISLALADFCVGLFVMPLAAIYVLEDRWIFGEILCRFWVTADLTLCTASILNLCAISVDRHLAVTRALRYSALRTRRRICLYICIVWLGALLVSAAPLALLPFPKIEQHCQVSQNRFYQIYATIISFWCPSLIMVIVYVKLWSAAKRMHRQDQLVLRWQGVHLPSDGDLEGLPPTNRSLFRSDSVVARANARFLFALRMSAQKFGYYDQNNNSITKNGTNTISDGEMINDENLRIEVRTSASSSGGGGGSSTLGTLRVPLVLIIMSAFIICWVPFFILVLAKSQHWVDYVPRWLDSLALWLGYSNSMLNPIIYCKYNREFRLPFGEMLCCRFRTIQDVMRNESYYAKFGSPRISETKIGGQRSSGRNGNNYSKRKRNNTERRAQKGESLILDSSKNAGIKRNSSPSILMESNRNIKS